MSGWGYVTVIALLIAGIGYSLFYIWTEDDG